MWVIRNRKIFYAVAALLTGVVQSLGTSWGLFRHYWVVIKLIITIISTGLLLVHTRLAPVLYGLTPTDLPEGLP